MQTINKDNWGKEVWGAATSEGTNSRDTANSNLILYWGKNVRHSYQLRESELTFQQDKLVANKTRDDLIAAKGHLCSKGTGVLSKNWKPSMLIDEDGIPHAFCLSGYFFPSQQHTLIWRCGQNTAKRWRKRSKTGWKRLLRNMAGPARFECGHSAVMLLNSSRCRSRRRVQTPWFIILEYLIPTSCGTERTVQHRAS